MLRLILTNIGGLLKLSVGEQKVGVTFGGQALVVWLWRGGDDESVQQSLHLATRHD